VNTPRFAERLGEVVTPRQCFCNGHQSPPYPLRRKTRTGYDD
jgi:hypothetical protein